MVLSDEHKNIVKSTAPVLKEHGKTITALFYKNVQEAHPELRNYFNQTSQSNGSQPLALAQTLYCAAEHIEKLDALMPQVEQIANKHCALKVKPEHYPIVGKFLLEAIAQVLGDKATPEILEAWKATYSVISSIFIGIEKQMYAGLSADERNKSFVPFKVVKKENIAGPIVELTLERADGGQLLEYQPGQYIALRVEKDGLSHNRFYGLTELFNGKTYSVLVRPEPEDAANATVSNEIVNNVAVGGTVLASNPVGTFALAKDAKHNLFVAGSVGIAPVAAMIKALSKDGKSDSASLIYCVRAADQAAYGDQLSAALPAGQYTVLVSDQPPSKDSIAEKLNADSHVYISGCENFVSSVDKCLAECGHPKAQIHSEAIGPTVCILNRLG